MVLNGTNGGRRMTKREYVERCIIASWANPNPNLGCEGNFKMIELASNEYDDIQLYFEESDEVEE